VRSSRITPASATPRSPGAGALARCQFARLCTSDLLAADVVGTNVSGQREPRFEFQPGLRTQCGGSVTDPARGAGSADGLPRRRISYP
jgi:hypothetical protein